MKKTIAAAAVLAALALTGCSTGIQSADAMPSATTTPSASATVAPAVSSASPSVAETKKVDVGQAWADDMINLFLNGHGAHSFDAFEGQVLGDIQAWKSTEIGHLDIEVGGDSWSKSDLSSVGETFMSGVGFENSELVEVNVSSAGSGESASFGRDDMENANPWSS